MGIYRNAFVGQIGKSGCYGLLATIDSDERKGFPLTARELLCSNLLLKAKSAIILTIVYLIKIQVSNKKAAPNLIRYGSLIVYALNTQIGQALF